MSRRIERVIVDECYRPGNHSGGGNTPAVAAR